MKSNETLLGARQNLIRVFKKYEYMLLPLLRFIVTVSALRMLIIVTNYTGTFSGLLPTFVLALIATFVSAQWILLGSIFLAFLFIFSTNPILAIIVFCMLMLLYIGFMRLFPKESILIIVTLIAFSIHMELAMPIVAALFGSYICIVCIILGVGLWFVMPQLASLIQSASLDKSEILDMVSHITQMDYKALLLNEQMLAYSVVFLIVFSVIYLIRKQSIDYAAYIAIGVGAVMNILGFLMAILFLDSFSENILSIIIWTVIYSGIAVVMQFFSIVLDYQRAEVVTFEDNDNYYYVKVVPKINMNTVNNTVKHVYTANSRNKLDDYQKPYDAMKQPSRISAFDEEHDYTNPIGFSTVKRYDDLEDYMSGRNDRRKSGSDLTGYGEKNNSEGKLRDYTSLIMESKDKNSSI